MIFFLVKDEIMRFGTVGNNEVQVVTGSQQSSMIGLVVTGMKLGRAFLVTVTTTDYHWDM